MVVGLTGLRSNLTGGACLSLHLRPRVLGNPWFMSELERGRAHEVGFEIEGRLHLRVCVCRRVAWFHVFVDFSLNGLVFMRLLEFFEL